LETKRPRRHAPKLKWRIEGEMEIGGRRELIEQRTPQAMWFVAAYSQAQATKLFADRFTEHFGVRVYLGNADVYQIGALAIDQIPVKPTFSSVPKASEQMVQLLLNV